MKLVYLGVCRRHEMKSIRHEISTHHERNFVYITFYCRQNEIKLLFESGLRKKVNHTFFLFNEINACTNVSFFREIYFGSCLHEILTTEMKFHFCQNDRNKVTPAMSFISGCIK